MLAFWETNATGANTAVTDFHLANNPDDTVPVNPLPFQTGPSFPPNGNDVFANVETDIGSAIVRRSEGLKYRRAQGCKVSEGVSRAISRAEKLRMLTG